MRKIVISDIHGFSKTFKALVEEKIKFTKADQLYILGDMVGRGPRPAALLDYIIDKQDAGYQINCLMGNHEQMLMLNVKNGKKSLHPKYLKFISSLPCFFEIDNIILVHAGLNLNIPNPLDDKNEMLWSFRQIEESNHAFLKGKTVVHGHIVKWKDDIIESITHKHQFIGIDNGVFLKYQIGRGEMPAFDFTNWKYYFQANLDN